MPEPKTMDPERLDRVRWWLVVAECAEPIDIDHATELLADRDHWWSECQAARRDLCRLLAASSTDYESPQDAARDLGWHDLDWGEEP